MTTPTSGLPDHAAMPVASATSVPSVPPTTPNRRTGLIIGGVVALVVLIAAGVTAALVLKPAPATVAAPPTTPPPATAAPTPVVTEPPAFAGPLQSVVIPKPAGAVFTPDKRKGDANGLLTKQDVASEYDNAADQATVLNLLTNLEFQRGVFLAWTDKATLVYVQVYQFRYDREAANWTVTLQQVIQDAATSTAVFDEIHGGRWFVTKTADGRGAAHAVYSKGPFAVQINTFKAGAADLDGTKKMAVDQYQLLP